MIPSRANGWSSLGRRLCAAVPTLLLFKGEWFILSHHMKDRSEQIATLAQDARSLAHYDEWNDSKSLRAFDVKAGGFSGSVSEQQRRTSALALAKFILVHAGHPCVSSDHCIPIAAGKKITVQRYLLDPSLLDPSLTRCTNRAACLPLPHAFTVPALPYRITSPTPVPMLKDHVSVSSELHLPHPNAVAGGHSSITAADVAVAIAAASASSSNPSLDVGVQAMLVVSQHSTKWKSASSTSIAPSSDDHMVCDEPATCTVDPLAPVATDFSSANDLPPLPSPASAPNSSLLQLSSGTTPSRSLQRGRSAMLTDAQPGSLPAKAKRRKRDHPEAAVLSLHTKQQPNIPSPSAAFDAESPPRDFSSATIQCAALSSRRVQSRSSPSPAFRPHMVSFNVPPMVPPVGLPTQSPMRRVAKRHRESDSLESPSSTGTVAVDDTDVNMTLGSDIRSAHDHHEFSDEPLPRPMLGSISLDCYTVMDALKGLRELPDACIDCVVTSPPYNKVCRSMASGSRCFCCTTHLVLNCWCSFSSADCVSMCWASRILTTCNMIVLR